MIILPICPSVLYIMCCIVTIRLYRFTAGNVHRINDTPTDSPFFSSCTIGKIYINIRTVYMYSYSIYV